MALLKHRSLAARLIFASTSHVQNISSPHPGQEHNAFDPHTGGSDSFLLTQSYSKRSVREMFL